MMAFDMNTLDFTGSRQNAENDLMDASTREKLENRLKELEANWRSADAAFDRENDKGYNTQHLRNARDYLNSIERQIEEIKKELGIKEV